MTDYCWHFVQVNKDGVPRLGYGDGREVKVGETLAVTGEPVLCERGLHACAKLLDALSYASGNKLALTRVILGGTVVHDDSKSVANERTVVAMLDADTTEKLLRDWGRWCALQVIRLWDAPDVVRQYLETGDANLSSAAHSAALSAADSAADSAAYLAAHSAADSAARGAARSAALSAAFSAARGAARSAALSTALSTAFSTALSAAFGFYTNELEHRVLAAMGQLEAVSEGGE